MSEPLTIDDIRHQLEIGRTSAYKLTKTPGFPPPLPTAQRGHRWDVDAVDAFLATQNAAQHKLPADAEPEGNYIHPQIRSGRISRRSIASSTATPS